MAKLWEEARKFYNGNKCGEARFPISPKKTIGHGDIKLVGGDRTGLYFRPTRPLMALSPDEAETIKGKVNEVAKMHGLTVLGGVIEDPFAGKGEAHLITGLPPELCFNLKEGESIIAILGEAKFMVRPDYSKGEKLLTDIAKIVYQVRL